MKQLVSKFAVFSILVSALPLYASEKEDRKAIRELFWKEQEGQRLGNEQMVRSAYWEDFYIIWTPRKNDIPRYMLTDILLGQDYLGGFKYEPFDPEKGRQLTREVNHISVNGDVALAITQFRNWGKAEGGGRFDRGWQTMWVAEKRKGKWKWKSAIVGFEGYEETAPAPQNSTDAE